MAELPAMIGKYKIAALIAKGGMGAVYKAVHPTLKRYVILKKLTIRGNASIIERFKREARLLMDFRNANIVHFFDYFKEGSSHYIVLEYIDGMSLDGLIKKRRYLSSQLALLIFLDACRALKYAHDNGIIHRDIKPANILISKKGSVKLADFGIATSEDDDDSGLTREGMTLGTPSYMPPEQFENSKNVDKRADIYAMGVMLYEMVSGKKPFPGNFAADTIMMIQKGRYTPIRRLQPDVGRLVSRLIGKMIRPDPKKRYQDMGVVIRIIERYLKHYNTEAIKETLVQSINSDLKDEPLFRPRTKKRLIIIPALVLTASLAIAAWGAQRQGLIQRWFRPNHYGPVSLSIRIPSELKDAADVFLKARLFVNDGDSFPELEKLNIRFSLQAAAEAGPYHHFASNTLQLAPGAYRLKLISEQRVYWTSFQVRSYSQLQASGQDMNRVDELFDQVRSRPLRVWHEASHALSGQNLTGLARLLVYHNNRWQPIGDIDPASLQSGRVWRFRSEAPGYYPELFSLLIGPSQDELQIRSELMPLPGRLRLVAPEENIRVQLDDSDTVILGGERIQYGSLREYRGGSAEWLLPAGRYSFSATYRRSSTQLNIEIPAEGTTTLVLSIDNGELSVRREN